MRFLTCSEYKADCSNVSIPVDANPDIAGKGVILSFLITTCFAIVIAATVMFLDRYPRIATYFRKRFLDDLEPYDEAKSNLPYWRKAVFWHKVLSKNLLSFSDTQLVTGLAIQFTAMIQHCKISIYHFQIVVELAFLTTITHLLALVALRNYFVRNKWINLPRIGFMLANLGLLSYTSYIAYSYELAGLHASHDLACFFQSERPGFRSAFAGRWATLLIGAIGGHVTVIAAMYFSVFYDRREDSDHINKRPSWTSWRILPWLGALVRTWIIAPGYAIYGLTMGGRALRGTQALGKASVDINGSEKEWSFGQFLPLLLLALPLFAGWESFWEEKDPDRDNRFGSSSRSRSGSRNALGAYELANKPRHRRRSGSDSDVEGGIPSHSPSPMRTPQVHYSPIPSQNSSPALAAQPFPSAHPGSRPSSRPRHSRQQSSGSLHNELLQQHSSTSLGHSGHSPYNGSQSPDPSTHPRHRSSSRPSRGPQGSSPLLNATSDFSSPGRPAHARQGSSPLLNVSSAHSPSKQHSSPSLRRSYLPWELGPSGS